MDLQIRDYLKTHFKASDAFLVEVIQELWSGYGQLSRWQVIATEYSFPVIVKNIQLPTEVNHPKGWNTARSHQRKMRSYQVEMAWYSHFSSLCDATIPLPTAYFTKDEGDRQLIVMQDLDAAGYPERKESLTIEATKVCLRWLANFHATFMGAKPNTLWETGTYWHLATRADEWNDMESGWLKDQASRLDQLLSNAQFQTLVHGDAKVANFCFSEDLKKVAAVDFQYVGGGCGMKDVAYFLGSCLTAEECKHYESDLLNHYFKALLQAIEDKQIRLDKVALEKEWRALYAIAWTDFSRFLKGWMPENQKLNSYSKELEQRAKALLA